MYHEVTYEEEAKRRRRLAVYALLAALIVVEVAFSAMSLQGFVRGEGVDSVRESVVAASVRCLAVEGSYPSSLAHLEEEYGLVVNHDDYVITYEWLGDNVPPSVAVRLR